MKNFIQNNFSECIIGIFFSAIAITIPFLILSCFINGCLERSVKREAIAHGMNPYMTVSVREGSEVK